MGIKSVGQSRIWLNPVHHLSLPPSCLAVYACSDEISPGFALRPLMLIFGGALTLVLIMLRFWLPKPCHSWGMIEQEVGVSSQASCHPRHLLLACLSLSCFTFGVAGDQNLSWWVAGGCSGLGRVYQQDYWHSRKIRGIWYQLPADRRGLTVLANCKNALSDVFPSSKRCQHAK